MTVINTNIGALNARHYSAKAELFVNKALERLSSGRRINSASDDAAGLAVASKMTSQVLGMKMAIRNTQDGISLVQTAEGSMNEINSMLLRMRELLLEHALYSVLSGSEGRLDACRSGDVYCAPNLRLYDCAPNLHCVEL